MTSVDIVVFGASGFTGRFVVRELVSLQRDPRYTGFTFGIAGKSSSRLHGVLSEIYDDHMDALKIPVFEANAQGPDSLLQMAMSSKLVINCVGPYRFYGEQVVAACVAAGTDYLDISGEPEFIERMVLKYHERAAKQGVVVVSACGFDSIPADLGVLYTLRQFDSDIRPDKTESFIQLIPKRALRMHVTTYETAIHSISKGNELKRIRKELGFGYNSDPGYREKLVLRKFPFFDPRTQKWAVLFPGSDSSVVRRTQMLLFNRDKAHKPTQYSAYISLSSWISLLLLTVLGFVVLVLAQFRHGRTLLLRYPEFFTNGVFSRQGVEKEELEQGRFQVDFFSTGYSDKATMSVHTRLTGPEPGYISTAILVTQAALCLLKSKQTSLTQSGVLTPGSLLADTDYLDRLEDRGIRFSLMEKQRT